MEEINHKELHDHFSEAKDYDVPALLSEEFVLFPGMEIITVVNERRSQTALREALREHQIVAFIPSDKSSSSNIGTLAIVKRPRPREEDSELASPVSEGSLELKGMWRIKIKKLVESSPGYPRAVFERANEAPASTPNSSELVNKVQAQIDEFVTLIPQIPREIVELLKHTHSPGELADLCANSPEFTHDEKVELLETLDQEERLAKVTKLFDKQLKALKKLTKVEPIADCDRCLELADKAFDSDPNFRAEIAVQFLNHVVRDHTGELLALLAEKYLPVFMNKRAMR